MEQRDTIKDAAPTPKWRRIKWVVQGLLVFCLLYYPIGALTIDTIDDNPNFTPAPGQAIAGGSMAVAMTAALVNREIHTHSWVANDPFFLPGALLDDMPAYQQGILSAAATFAYELKDQIGRLPTGRLDPGLQEAAGLLQYSGKRWRWDFSTSLWPVSTSEEQYARAVQLLLAYNNEVAKGGAVFGRRADALLATLNRIALNLASSSAALDIHIKSRSGGWVDKDADDLFYSVKGQAYGYAMILSGLRSDFGGVIKQKELASAWDRLDDSLKTLTALRPKVVTNGRPDGLLVPNHLTAEGFYLLQARIALQDITSALAK